MLEDFANLYKAVVAHVDRRTVGSMLMMEQCSQWVKIAAPAKSSRRRRAVSL